MLQNTRIMFASQNNLENPIKMSSNAEIKFQMLSGILENLDNFVPIFVPSKINITAIHNSYFARI